MSEQEVGISAPTSKELEQCVNDIYKRIQETHIPYSESEYIKIILDCGCELSIKKKEGIKEFKTMECPHGNFFIKIGK